MNRSIHSTQRVAKSSSAGIRPDAVPFGRVDGELRRDAARCGGRGTSRRPVPAAWRRSFAAGCQQRRRPQPIAGEHRAPRVVLPAGHLGRVATEERAHPVDQRGVEVLGVPVGDRRDRHGDPEPVVDRREPRGHEPAVAAADHADARRVGDAPLDQEVHAREIVERVGAAHVADDRARRTPDRGRSSRGGWARASRTRARAAGTRTRPATDRSRPRSARRGRRGAAGTGPRRAACRGSLDLEAVGRGPAERLDRARGGGGAHRARRVAPRRGPAPRRRVTVTSSGGDARCRTASSRSRPSPSGTPVDRPRGATGGAPPPLLRHRGGRASTSLTTDSSPSSELASSRVARPPVPEGVAGEPVDRPGLARRRRRRGGGRPRPGSGRCRRPRSPRSSLRRASLRRTRAGPRWCAGCVRSRSRASITASGDEYHAPSPGASLTTAAARSSPSHVASQTFRPSRETRRASPAATSMSHSDRQSSSASTDSTSGSHAGRSVGLRPGSPTPARRPAPRPRRRRRAGSAGRPADHRWCSTTPGTLTSGSASPRWSARSA